MNDHTVRLHPIKLVVVDAGALWHPEGTLSQSDVTTSHRTHFFPVMIMICTCPAVDEGPSQSNNHQF